MTTSTVEKETVKASSERARFDTARRMAKARAKRTLPVKPQAPSPSLSPYAGADSLSSVGAFQWGGEVPCDITPSWVGGDGAFCPGEDAAGTPALRRTIAPGIDAYASPVSSIAALELLAGRAGIAPRVLAVDLEEGQVATERKDAPWRRAKLDDFMRPGFLEAVLRQRRRCHDLAGDASVLAERSIVDDVGALFEACVDANVPLPREVGRILARMQPFIRRVRAGAFALPAVPCHGDGAASNVLVRFDAAGRLAEPPLLTGWTVSGLMDPTEDAGSVIAEVGMFAPLSASEIVEALGLPTSCTPVAKAFAVLDDVRWALIGLLRTARATDPSIDYAKYGLWRLTKCEAAFESDEGIGSWLKGM